MTKKRGNDVENVKKMQKTSKWTKNFFEKIFFIFSVSDIFNYYYFYDKYNY